MQSIFSPPIPTAACLDGAAATAAPTAEGTGGVRGLPAYHGGETRGGRPDGGALQRLPPAHGPPPPPHHFRQPQAQRHELRSGRTRRRRAPGDAPGGRRRWRRRAQRAGVLRPHGSAQSSIDGPRRSEWLGLLTTCAFCLPKVGTH